MNKIKNKLLEAANRQDIHDLSSDIISKVDTSKVKMSFEPIKRRRPIFAIGGVVSALAACSVAVAIVGVSLSSSNKDNSAPSDSVIEDDNLTSNQSIYLADYASDIYTLASIAINNIDNDMNSSTGGFLTKENEKIIVDEINPYISTIESFLKKETVSFKYSEVDFLGYDSLLNVSSDDGSVSFYYNEILETEKNVGEVNYKSYSTVEGLIKINDSLSYKVEGYKRIKNGKIDTYLDVLLENENKISLQEIKSDIEVDYRFKEYINGKENYINIVNRIDKEVVRFEQSFKLDFVIKADILQADFADGYNDELLTVNFINDTIVYHFKNSDNSISK